jgi:hypothetical protein
LKFRPSYFGSDVLSWLFQHLKLRTIRNISCFQGASAQLHDGCFNGWNVGIICAVRNCIWQSK